MFPDVKTKFHVYQMECRAHHIVSQMSAQCPIFVRAVARTSLSQRAPCIWADERHGVLYEEVLRPLFPDLLSQGTIFNNMGDGADVTIASLKCMVPAMARCFSGILVPSVLLLW